MSNIAYNFLFTIELLHKYFQDEVCTDFDITPSLCTSYLSEGHKIITKTYNNKLYAGLQLDNDLKPLLVPEDGLQLTFFLKLNNPLFFNYTELPFVYTPNTVYYFTNRYNNVKGSKNLLHKNEFMSSSDALEWKTSLSTFKFSSPRNLTKVNVYGYNRSSNDYTELLFSNTLFFKTNTSVFNLDLSQLKAGAYRLTVDEVDKLIYLNDEQNTSKAFAVVDIFVESTLAAAYKILKPDNSLLSPLYSVNFLNRSTIWKYNLVSLNPAISLVDAQITSEVPAYSFTKKTPTTIFSDLPIPLSEKPLILTLTINPGDPVTKKNYTPIKCAAPSRLIKYKPDPPDAFSEIVYCSEIFINY